MAERQKQSHPNEDDQRHNRDAEHPQRPEPETLEGPGGRESKAEEGERDSATRRGES